MKKKLKTILILLGIIIVVGVAAQYVLRSSAPATDTTRPLTSSRAAGVALPTGTAAPTEFSVLLSTIKGINIDTKLFTSPAYRSLRDYPVALGTDSIGRPNPFAPIGYDAVVEGSTDATPVQFQTLQPGKITSTSAEFGGQGLLSTTAQTSVVFEYGTSDLFGSATPPVAVGKNGTALFTVTGLLPNTQYYVRAVLAQGSITTQGNTMTFTTLSALR